MVGVASATMDAGGHLSEHTVLRFLAGGLRDEALLAADLHLQDCAECLELLAVCGAAAEARPPGSASEGRPPTGPEEGTGLAAPPAPRIGQYEIHDCVGEGGMGVVYRAWATADNRWVALKRVRLARSAAIGSLRREIHALRCIDHPGVVRVLDQGIAGGLPWYAMELIHGDTLDSRIRAVHTGKPPDFEAVVPLLRVIRRLCRTLAVLHGEGIVHRDLTPRNVVLQGGDTPMLVDFGLASQAPRGGREGVDQVEGGTPWYMAPEQIDRELVDARADLYALGCILYEIFTGDTPFPKQSGARPGELLRSIAAAPLPGAPVLPGLPGELADLTLRLLARKPSDRLGYAADVARVLERTIVRDDFVWSAAAPRPYLYRPGMVARTQLIEEIDLAISASTAGRGGSLTISGDSGIGKTRLLLNAAGRARGHRVRVVTAGCAPPASAVPGTLDPAPPLNAFRPILQVIADLCRQRGAAVRHRLLGGRETILATFEPALRELSDEDGHSEEPPLPAEAARFQLFEAMRATLQAFARLGSPLMLVIDDLQWLDDLSRGFLERLDRDFLERNGILLVGSYREQAIDAELRRHLESLGSCRLVEPLAASEIEDIMTDMLGVPRCAPELVALVARLSSGNPYFVTEYLRMAVEQGWLASDDSGHWLTTVRGREALARIERLPTPLSLAGVLAERVAHLAAGPRAVAQFATVIGSRFTLDELHATPGLSGTDLLEAVDDLLGRHILDVAPDDRLEFAHDRIREVASASIWPDALAGLHRIAATWLEARPDDPDRLADLAHHWQMAGDPDREHQLRCRAGERAFRIGAYRDAISHLQRALALRPRGNSLADAVRIERQLAEAHFGIGDMVASRRCILSLAQRADLPMPAGALATAHRALSDIAGALLRHATTPLLLTRSTLRRRIMAETARAYERLAHVLFFENELVGVTSSSLRALGAASRLGPSPELARVYANLSVCAALIPLPDLAEALTGQAAAIADRIDDPSARAWCRLMEGVYRAGRGDFAAAYTLLQLALGQWQQLGDRRRWEETLTLLGMCCYHSGRFDEAATLRRDLEKAGRDSASHQTIGWALIGQAEDRMLRGEWEPASAALEEADTLGSDVRRVEQMWLKALLARVRLLQADRIRALAAANQGLALLSQIPTAFYVLEGNVALVEVYLGLVAGASPDERATLDKQARKAMRALTGFARVFPFARGRALLWRGMRCLVDGHSDRARGIWAEAIPLAEGQGRTHDLALLWDCLARHPASADTVDDWAARHAQGWHRRALGASAAVMPD
jgi:eukaryotic-like serine/threonine-protein kinase